MVAPKLCSNQNLRDNERAAGRHRLTIEGREQNANHVYTI